MIFISSVGYEEYAVRRSGVPFNLVRLNTNIENE